MRYAPSRRKIKFILECMLDEDLMPDYRYVYHILCQSGENMYMSYRRGGIAAFCEALSNFTPRYFDTTGSFNYGRLDAKKLRAAIMDYKRYTPFEFTTEDKVYMMAYQL